MEFLEAISCYPFQSFASAAADTKGFPLLSGLGTLFYKEGLSKLKFVRKLFYFKKNTIFVNYKILFTIKMKQIMSEKHVVVSGATCKCNFSVEPKTDILQVKSQNKHFANDKNAEKKLIATDKEIGQTLKANTFGKCKKQPAGNDYLPCKAVITKWSGFYEKITLSNQGKILVEDSKATCPIGGPDCIVITKHGQKAEISKQQLLRSNREILRQINPLIDLDDFEDEDSICS